MLILMFQNDVLGFIINVMFSELEGGIRLAYRLEIMACSKRPNDIFSHSLAMTLANRRRVNVATALFSL